MKSQNPSMRSSKVIYAMHKKVCNVKNNQIYKEPTLKKYFFKIYLKVNQDTCSSLSTYYPSFKDIA